MPVVCMPIRRKAKLRATTSRKRVGASGCLFKVGHDSTVGMTPISSAESLRACSIIPECYMVAVGAYLLRECHVPQAPFRPLSHPHLRGSRLLPWSMGGVIMVHSVRSHCTSSVPLKTGFCKCVVRYSTVSERAGYADGHLRHGAHAPVYASV